MKEKDGFPHLIQDLTYMVMGAFISGFALRSFLLPNKFLDGGVTGISLLLHELFHWNIAIIILLANIPLIILGALQINKTFAIKTLVCVLLLSTFLHFIPFHEFHYKDRLLISLFGGFFLGIGVGLAMRGGCALDGMEVLALYTWRRSGFTITEIILAMNVVIFMIAALKFGLETALYSVLTYYSASRTIDYVVEGLEEYTGVTIISAESETIKRKLVTELGRGITVYKGERGFLRESFEQHQDCDIVFTVITRLEVRRLRNVVNDIDPKAFVFTNTIKEAAGGVLKRRVTH